LYSGELPTKDFSHRESGDNMEAGFELLANLYVLGGRRMDAKLRNAIIHEMLRVQTLPVRIPAAFGFNNSCVPSSTSVIAHGRKAWHSSTVDRAFSFDVMEGFLRQEHPSGQAWAFSPGKRLPALRRTLFGFDV
jgi:hypothetical protein